MKKVTTNPRTAAQNRKLYWLLGQLNIHDADVIAEMVWEATNHRTFHTSEMSFMECMLTINRLTTEWREAQCRQRKSVAQRIDESTDGPARMSMDKKRKGLIRAIYGWFNRQGKQPTMEYVKAVACRAAGAESFNKISPEALTRLYAEFCRKQRAIESMDPDNFTISMN